MEIQQTPFSSSESSSLSQWFAQPGQQLLVRSLKARIAQHQAECGRLMTLALPDNGYQREADEQAAQARQLTFMLEEIGRYATQENYQQHDLKITIV